MNAFTQFRILVIGRESPETGRAFERIPVLEIRQVTSIDEAVDLSASPDARESIGALVVDLRIAGDGPYFAGIDRLREAYPGLPTIVLADRCDEGIALATMRRGVDDYLLRESLDAETITRSLRSARRIAELEYRLGSLDTQLEQANRRLRDILLDMARQRHPSLERSARMVRALEVPSLPVTGLQPAPHSHHGAVPTSGSQEAAHGSSAHR